MKDNYFNEIKIDDGLIVNGNKIKHLKNVEINSGLDNLSEITVIFYGKVDGLDNIKEEYAFKPLKALEENGVSFKREELH